ncbi:MAG: MFS transporter [Candidatus Omnitrophica bacterium]|nr:MFS transporter [Candidatus Omnitrophota bacterium]
MNNANCKSRSFQGLMVTQFLGAFNDNAFKVVVSLLALRNMPQTAEGAQFVSMIGALFIIPFILFSPYAGFLADRFSKRSVIIAAKIAEALVMGLGFFALASGNLLGLCAVLFLLSAQSAFFSPAKYGILPEILDNAELSKGNGYLQMWTFLAIIFGTACGGQIVTIFFDISYASIFFIFISAVGIAASIFITRVPAHPAQQFEVNAFRNTVRTIKDIKRNKPLFLTLVAICYFWFSGAVFQMNAILFGKTVLVLSEIQVSILLTAAAFGIGLGSALAGRLSGGKVEFGLVPVGALGMTAFYLMLGNRLLSFSQTLLFVLFIGIFGGFFIIPLNAYFQQQSPPAERGRFLAASNLLSSMGILFASVILWFLGTVIGFDAARIFSIMGLLSFAAMLYIFRTLPDTFLRFFNWVLTHTIYRVRVSGIEHIPQEGGALIVCNHVSYVDPSLLLASVQRPIRFLIYRGIYDNVFLKPFCRIVKGIPVSLYDGPKAMMKSLKEAREAIEAGDLVCIFAEGGLTRTGNMLPFNQGFEHIMKDLDAPIIPACIDSIWGSVFTYENGRYFWKMPKRFPHPIAVCFGAALPSFSKTHQVRLAVQELMADAFAMRGPEQKKLHIEFIHEAKKHPFRFCMADSTGVRLSYIKVLTAVMVMSQQLFGKDEEESPDEMVGVYLPASCAASLVNGAILFSGKIPVNLNFTGSKESLDSAVRQCGMRRIVTSRKFLEKASLEEREGMIFLEDIQKEITQSERIKTLLAALLLPPALIKIFFVKGNKVNTNDVATIIFSSGSTGEPKGVMLTHTNIFSNIEGLYQVLNLRRGDVVMGVLPFFHSFGFTATLCCPVGVGIGVVYHANPLDAGTVGRLIKKYKATVLMGTPTFISAYMRKCTKEQFQSLRYVVVGAEKLKQNVSEAFYEKFNLIPFEGYGATELSPIVSMGIPDYISRKEDITQTGHKEGTVGHPIPGVAAKIVNPDSFEQLSTDEEGLLLIKGPNVMKGYLNQPEKTKEVIRDGWYISGDIATIDKDGFICITDRLSRFSKIGGEMVPHIKIEGEISNILGAVEPVCVVTAVPDEKKGERLAVLYTGDLNIEEIWGRLNQREIPKLWIPKREHFYQVKEIPLLGSGKLDLKKIKSMAREIAASATEGGANDE